MEPATDELVLVVECYPLDRVAGSLALQLQQQLAARIRQEQARAEDARKAAFEAEEDRDLHMRASDREWSLRMDAEKRAEAAERKRDALKRAAERDADVIESLSSQLGDMTMERDALAAQVAYMLNGMAQAISDETGDPIDAISSDMAANLPAAASRYLAADRVAQEWDAYVRVHSDENAHRESVRQFWGAAIAALDDWRKAAGR
jgi:hypothetical protein